MLSDSMITRAHFAVVVGAEVTGTAAKLEMVSHTRLPRHPEQIVQISCKFMEPYLRHEKKK